MKFLKLFSILIVLMTNKNVNAANILMIQTDSSFSHIAVEYPLLYELARRGHNLIIFTPKLMTYDSNLNVKQFLIKDEHEGITSDFHPLNPKNANEETHKKHFITDINMRNERIVQHLQNVELRNLFLLPEKHKFDLIMIESDFFIFEMLAEIYDCPIVKFCATESPMTWHQRIGNSIHPAIHSEIYSSTALHGNLTYSQRYDTCKNLMYGYKKEQKMDETENSIKKVFLASVNLPGREIARKRLGMMLSFVDPITISVRPTIQSVQQYAGFLHIEPPSLHFNDTKIKKLLDNSKHGVILMSMGSVFGDFDEKALNVVIETFRALPYDVIMKVNLESYEKKFIIPKNVYTSSWLPIRDILGHPNLKLFITHGGMRSIEEAIDRKVPMVFIPIFVDQPFNAELLSSRNLGMTIRLWSLTKEALTNAIHEVIKGNYKKNLVKYRTFVNDKIASSLETAVLNIEYLIHHKDMYQYQLYVARDNSSFIQFNVDIHAILTILLIASSYLLKFVIKFCRNRRLTLNLFRKIKKNIVNVAKQQTKDIQA